MLLDLYKELLISCSDSSFTIRKYHSYCPTANLMDQLSHVRGEKFPNRKIDVYLGEIKLIWPMNNFASRWKMNSVLLTVARDRSRSKVVLTVLRSFSCLQMQTVKDRRLKAWFLQGLWVSTFHGNWDKKLSCKQYFVYLSNFSCRTSTCHKHPMLSKLNYQHLVSWIILFHGW